MQENEKGILHSHAQLSGLKEVFHHPNGFGLRLCVLKQMKNGILARVWKEGEILRQSA